MIKGVFQYQDCSTSHVTKETMRYLKRISGNNNIGQTVASYEYGCFISVSTEAEYHKDVPEDLRTVLDFARGNECLVLRLDADGCTYPNLPIFDW